MARRRMSERARKARRAKAGGNILNLAVIGAAGYGVWYFLFRQPPMTRQAIDETVAAAAAASQEAASQEAVSQEAVSIDGLGQIPIPRSAIRALGRPADRRLLYQKTTPEMHLTASKLYRAPMRSVPSV